MGTLFLTKHEEDFLNVCQRDCLRTVMGTYLIGSMSNNKLYENCGSITLSRTVTIERLRRLGHALGMKNDR